MNLLQRILNLVSRPLVRYTGPVAGNGAGMLVTHETSLAQSAVWACVRAISEAIASLDWQILQDSVDGKTSTRIRNTPLDRLLNRQPNGEMSAFTWRETVLAHVLLTGNHYSEIERDSMGRVIGVWPLIPDNVRVMRNTVTNAIEYHCWQHTGTPVILEPDNVLHVKGLGWDGVTGYSILTMARRAIGMGLAMDETGANFYRNGAQVGLIFQHPKFLSEAAQNNLKQSLKEAYSGPGNAFRTLVIEEGMTVGRPQMTMIDAQFLESRKFGVADIARWFRVPPHKIGDLERSTNNNIEQQSIEFVRDCLVPWCERLQQEVDIKLVQPRANVRTHLDTSPLLHGTLLERFTAYEKARNGGWYCADDIRYELNMNPLPDGKGQIFLQPLNYVEAGTQPAPQPAIAAPGAEPAKPEPKSETVVNLNLAPVKLVRNADGTRSVEIP